MVFESSYSYGHSPYGGRLAGRHGCRPWAWLAGDCDHPGAGESPCACGACGAVGVALAAGRQAGVGDGLGRGCPASAFTSAALVPRPSRAASAPARLLRRSVVAATPGIGGFHARRGACCRAEGAHGWGRRPRTARRGRCDRRRPMRRHVVRGTERKAPAAPARHPRGAPAGVLGSGGYWPLRRAPPPALRGSRARLAGARRSWPRRPGVNRQRPLARRSAQAQVRRRGLSQGGPGALSASPSPSSSPRGGAETRPRPGGAREATAPPSPQRGGASEATVLPSSPRVSLAARRCESADGPAQLAGRQLDGGGPTAS